MPNWQIKNTKSKLCTKPNLPNLTYQTKHTKPKHQSKSTKIKFTSHIGKFKPNQSIKVNKDLIKARLVEAFPELCTAQLQLVKTQGLCKSNKSKNQWVFPRRLETLKKQVPNQKIKSVCFYIDLKTIVSSPYLDQIQ